ncbi:MAG TPA: hypothetical protein VF116_02655 [Ktedonobacterales bacterium]
MRYRMLGGLLGWLVALLPLAAVNLANLAALFSFQEAVLAGGIAIVIGLLLGGAVAGLVGGRQRPMYRGGSVGGAGAGGFAALLYLVTVFVLLAVASYANSTPLLLQDDLRGVLWMLTALAFIALLFIAIATGAGALAGRRAPKGTLAARSSARIGVTSRQPIPARSAPGQPSLRLPSSSSTTGHTPAAMQRPPMPDAYPGVPAPRTPASVPRPHGASSRTSRQR